MSISILGEISDLEKKADQSKEKAEQDAIENVKTAKLKADRAVAEAKGRLEALHAKKVHNLVEKLEQEKRQYLDKAEKDVAALQALASKNKIKAIKKIIDDFKSHTK